MERTGGETYHENFGVFGVHWHTVAKCGEEVGELGLIIRVYKANDAKAKNKICKCYYHMYLRHGGKFCNSRDRKIMFLMQVLDPVRRSRQPERMLIGPSIYRVQGRARHTQSDPKRNQMVQLSHAMM